MLFLAPRTTLLATAARQPLVRRMQNGCRSLTTISAAIKEDRQKLRDQVHTILAAAEADDRDKALRYRNLFAWQLARHAVAEELILYPAVEKYILGGKEIAERERRETQLMKEDLYYFQCMHPEATDFVPTLESLWTDLAAHIANEERVDLPALEGALNEAGSTRSADLAKEFEVTKHFIPTRSHPTAPQKPPFETVVGLLTAPIDKLGDLFRKFPRK